MPSGSGARPGGVSDEVGCISLSPSIMDFSRPLFEGCCRTSGEGGYRYFSLMDFNDFLEVPRGPVLDDPAKKGDDPTARLLTGRENPLLRDNRADGGWLGLFGT